MDEEIVANIGQSQVMQKKIDTFLYDNLKVVLTCQYTYCKGIGIRCSILLLGREIVSEKADNYENAKMRCYVKLMLLIRREIPRAATHASPYEAMIHLLSGTFRFNNINVHVENALYTLIIGDIITTVDHFKKVEEDDDLAKQQLGTRFFWLLVDTVGIEYIPGSMFIFYTNAEMLAFEARKRPGYLKSGPKKKAKQTTEKKVGRGREEKHKKVDDTHDKDIDVFT